jgi:hypothetical protein
VPESPPGCPNIAPVDVFRDPWILLVLREALVTTFADRPAVPPELTGSGAVRSRGGYCRPNPGEPAGA